MDVRLLCFLGLHRLQPVHAAMVREHSGGDAILYCPEHGIVVGAQHAAGHRKIFRAVRDPAPAIDQKTATSARYDRGLDPVDAGPGYVSHRPAFPPRYRRAPQCLGFALPSGDRMQPCFYLSKARWTNFALSRTRSASDRIAAANELIWLPRAHLPRWMARPFRSAPGSESYSSFFSLASSSWSLSVCLRAAMIMKQNERSNAARRSRKCRTKRTPNSIPMPGLIRVRASCASRSIAPWSSR